LNRGNLNSQTLENCWWNLNGPYLAWITFYCL
jgi:hypothetical protein